LGIFHKFNKSANDQTGHFHILAAVAAADGIYLHSRLQITAP
jgi:hypothetical protein